MNNKYKEWIKIILLPHLITAIFLGPAIIVFWSGGFVGLYSVINVFSELGSLKYYNWNSFNFYNVLTWVLLEKSDDREDTDFFCDIFMVSLRFFMPRVADINLLK